jgi:protein kinase C substrate 80K-H
VIYFEADSSRAQQAYQEAENALKRMNSEKETKENDVKDIFNIDGFGAKGEWKKLDGTCLEKDTGE